MGERRGMGWEGRKRSEGWEGGGRGRRGAERGEDVEGPGKWSAPGPVLALGGPACYEHLYSSQMVAKMHDVAR